MGLCAIQENGPSALHEWRMLRSACVFTWSDQDNFCLWMKSIEAYIQGKTKAIIITEVILIQSL